MKKILTISLLSVLIFSGCGSPIDNTTPSNSAGTQAVSIENESTADEQTIVSSENNESELESSSEALKDDTETEITDLNSDDIVEIKEKMFVAQTDDIYFNTNEYLGKTIKYEGYFSEYYSEELDKLFYFVVRNGPGCCGNDALVGFEVVWDEEFPEVNDWVEVSGVLEAYEEGGYSYLRITLESLTVLDVRGEETVYQ